MYEFVLSYVMVEFFCLICSLLLFFKTNHSLGTESEVKRFRWLVCSFCAYLVVDMQWAMIAYCGWDYGRFMFQLLSILDMLTLVYVPYSWFRYAEECLRADFTQRWKFKVICRVSIVVVSALIITSPWTHLLFMIDQQGMFYFGPYAMILTYFGFGYFVFATTHGIVNLICAKSQETRERSASIVKFIIPIIVTIFLYYVFDLSMIVAPAIFTSLLFYFLDIQDKKIYNDSLTGLNNRRKWEKYCRDMQNTLSDEHPLYVYYLDIDEFKQINDQYGHFEGDRALMILGNALRMLSYEHSSFVCRIGGDEFLVATHANECKKPEDVIDIINEYIDRQCTIDKIKYPLSVSVGCVKCIDPDVDIEEYLKEADHSMYEQKRVHNNDHTNQEHMA